MMVDRFAWSRFACVLVALWFAACSGGDSADRAAGAEAANVIESRGPYAESSVSPEAVVRIGVVDGPPAYQFHTVRFAGRLGDGRIVVVDGGSREVRWYDSTGRHRASAGQRGEGPGEFRNIRSAVLASGDTVVVHDIGNQRLTWLSPAESIVREAALAASPLERVALLNVLADGSVAIGHSRPVDAFGASEFTYTRDELTLILASAAGIDTVAVLEGDEAVTWGDYVNGQLRRTARLDLPFGLQVLVGATRQHIVVGNPERRQLEFRDPAANVVRIARRSDDRAVPLSSRDRARFLADMAVQVRNSNAPDPELVLRGARARLALLPEGRTLPPFDRLLVAADERIWVRDYQPRWASADAQTWTIHDPDGSIVARMTTPAGLDITHAAPGHITGIRRDSLGVEYVEVHQIVLAGR